MKAIAVLLMVLMFAKDASHLGDRFLMSGAIQGACLLYGKSWLLVNLQSGWPQRYLLVFSYVFVLFMLRSGLIRVVHSGRSSRCRQ
jgi:hypothetical protein